MCRALGLSRSVFYSWRGRAERRVERASSKRALESRIQTIHADSRGTYGSPRVHAQLRQEGMHISRKSVERVMRRLELRGKIRRRSYRASDGEPTHPLAPNTLNRQFSAKACDQVWMTDFTRIPLVSGHVFLSVVIDLHSRMVVGWALDSEQDTELVETALKMALRTRAPGPGILHHSDQGCQYTSNSYRDLLERHGIQASMSRRGNCWDNAVVESFFGTLKQELVHHAQWRTLAQARAALKQYIEAFYNRKRLHSALGYLSPADFEAKRTAI
jgi:putative transposase